MKIINNNNDEIIIGERVHFTTWHGTKENGIVKSFNETKTAAYVVYKCNEDWKNYFNYTGNLSNINYLTPGWIDNPKL